MGRLSEYDEVERAAIERAERAEPTPESRPPMVYCVRCQGLGNLTAKGGSVYRGYSGLIQKCLNCNGRGRVHKP